MNFSLSACRVAQLYVGLPRGDLSSEAFVKLEALRGHNSRTDPFTFTFQESLSFPLRPLSF
jgi:hypothetical protein